MVVKSELMLRKVDDCDADDDDDVCVGWGGHLKCIVHYELLLHGQMILTSLSITEKIIINNK